ncbi:MAG: L,D-transpeptidase [Chloroflexota bacterium]|nr:L,D-transpeptidase [Chloroflexota bacterium]
MKDRVLIGIAAILAIVTAGVGVALGAFGAGASDDPSASTGVRPVARATVTPGRVVVAGRAAHRARRTPVPTALHQPRYGRYFAILEQRRGARVPMLDSPGGRLVKSLSGESEFGSPRVLGVARQSGSWLGVTTPLRPDGELGWVRFDAAKLKLYWTRYSLRVLLSKRILELHYGGRVLGRYTVTVGAAGSDTPRGRFSITDALSYDHSPFYGCCALALSGSQEHLPLGWLGGNRIAIHGTPGPVGYAASHGCIRATDETMRTLFRRVPLGTPVFVDG